MVLEGALTVGGISLLTLIITKLKFYVKTNGTLNYGCGFTDAQLVNNDDDTEIKQIDMGDSVHVLYVKNKHHIEHCDAKSEYETDSD